MNRFCRDARPGPRVAMMALSATAGLAAALSSGPAAAHPHVWVEGRTELVIGQDKSLRGLRHAWTFDEMFSAAAIIGLDTDNDGIYSREELAPLAQINIESLGEYDFFTFVSGGGGSEGGGGEAALEQPSDYWLDYDDGRLTLHFTMMLQAPLKAEGAPIQLEVYDPEYFVAFSFADSGAVTQAEGGPPCSAELNRSGGPSLVQQEFLSRFGREEMLPGGGFGQMFAEKVVITCP